MGMNKVEFEFPDPDSVDEDVELEIEPSSELKVGEEAEEEEKVEKKQEVKEEKPEIEVEDDTPEADRNRRKGPEPEELTDDELAEYSERVQKRLKGLTRGYHDERREKEAAQRERQAAIDYANSLREENEALKQQGNVSKAQLYDAAKSKVETDLQIAKRAYREAYDDGDAEKIIEAQDALTKAQFRSERLAEIQPPSLQEDDDEVKTKKTDVNVSQEETKPQISPRVKQWYDENTWFGSDEEMSSVALGYHQRLVKDGVDPNSEEYYGRIDARMRQVFPERFDDVEVETKTNDTKQEEKRSQNVVAPTTRSTKPTKVRLTRSQVAIAKKLGISLEDYAKQVAIDMGAQK